MARILWMSDTPLRPTGFGLVTREVCRRLARRGHDVIILGWWDSGTEHDYGDVRVVPCPVAPDEASTALLRCVARFGPDVLVTLGDLPWISYAARPPVRSCLDRAGTAWLAYYPVDGTLADGTLPADWCAILGQADMPVAMSRYGAEATERSGLSAAMIPHGCDTALFRRPRDKDAAKRIFDCSGRFVILSDARNHRRKLLPRLLDIVRSFAAGKDDVTLLLHTNHPPSEDRDAYAYDLLADIEIGGLGGMVRLGDTAGPGGLPMAAVAAMYAAADVHLSASWGEGFGLPTLQAAAAGVVPVAGDHSATTELLGEHGIAIAAHETTRDEFGLVRSFIDRAAAARALERLYADQENRMTLAEAGRRFALGYGWDGIVTQWEAIFATTTVKHARAPAVLRRIDQHKRPTGHDATTLPPPRLVVPVGKSSTRPDIPAAVLTSEAHLAALRDLSRIFPGLVVRSGRDCRDVDRNVGDLNDVILVVDPDRDLGPSLDTVCAARGIGFLGPSPYWPPVDEANVTMQARKLLTDQPLSERRVAVASSNVG